MADSAAVLNALHGVASRISDDASERDVETAFLQEGFFTQLGYQGIGYDLRSEWKLPDDKRPDYATLNDNQAVTAVFEFKNPSEDLSGHESQLFHYTDELKSEYGVLLNGRELRLFRRDDGSHTRLSTVNLADATQAHARELSGALEKPTWDTTDPAIITEYVGELEPVSLEDELGREEFFETFRLEEGSPFAKLVVSSMGILQELRDEREAKFVKGAYDFWDASYASVPDDDEIPESWEPFIDGDESIKDFMFCLESGHALLARLLLAKASEDHDFFPDNRGLRRYFDELPGYGDEINLDAYPVAAQGLIDDMKNQLVESLFEDDIFIWWTDAYTETTTTQHANPYNRFREVAQEGSEITRVSEPVREQFSRAVADVFFSILKFDFSQVAGDPLGNLYQRYFDPETRKALGEFYTPQEVVDYIMDGVDYDVGVSAERLIDPACGSGTFLVEAVQRYKQDVRRFNDDPDWEEHLIDLCSRPNIVGLDVHPFAVLMAQIRFMVEILPEYREAKRNNPQFTIRRLPIFRTDSLRNERKSTGIDLGEDGQRQLTFDSLTEDNQDVLIPVPLPVEVDEDEVEETEGDFLVQRVRMPLFDTIQLQTGVRNFGEYFAALQGVLDVVKYHMSQEWWEYGGGLQEGISRYTTREYEGVEEFFAPYVDDILSTVQYLREDHGDGRLFKILEDSVLSLVVKNFMRYDYVVGNPPYVRKEAIPSDYKNNLLNPTYPDVYSGNTDLSVYFLRRGMELLEDGGSLGYITSIKFINTAYGSGIREIISEEAIIKEFSNFELSNFFEDASAYPCVLVLENREPPEEYDIDVVYGKEKPPDDELREVVEEIRSSIGESERYDHPYFATYKTAFSDLEGRAWRFTPKEANEVYRKVEKLRDDTLEEITESISAGIKTGKNTVFILDREEAEELEIENELLKPIYRGSDINRYKVGRPDEYLIYTHGIDIEDYPKAYDYLSEHKESLENRKDATFRNKDKEWYELNIPHSPEEMEADKIICPEMSRVMNYALDRQSRYILNKVFFFHPVDEYQPKMEFLLGLLNSSVLEFYLKQDSSPLRNGYYQFLTRYQKNLPVKSDEKTESVVTEAVETIRNQIEIQDRVAYFPEAYIDDLDGEVDYIDYEWQTRRYPVNADIQAQADGMFAVEAGRSDSITDPRMNSEDRAKYVHAAVDGRNMKSDEEMSIPIPRRDEDVRALLDALEQDEETVGNTDISELEAEIDEAVYDLFDLTDEEREVVEDYLEVF